MKTKNKIIASIFALMVIGGHSYAQNTAGTLNDAGRLGLTPYVSPAVEGIPEGAKSMLKTKLSSIATSNGLSGGSSPRFIITANINVLTKDITPTAPPMTAVTLEVTLCIGDGIDGTKFASNSITVKGVGTNENKAYIEAVKQIKPADPTIQAFVDKGKTKIMEYYNSKCDFIIKEAQTLAGQNQQDEAIYRLTSVPDVCKACYDKCMAAVAPIYKQKIDRECKLKLAEATNTWNASQDAAAASSAGEILSSIEPSAACFPEAKALAAKIQKRVMDIDKREWAYTMKEQQQASEMIKAYRDVGVAYGNGQPQNVTYNTVGWW